jgi:hypothetical protein
MSDDMYARRILISRNYTDVNVRFDIRISNLPMHNLERFGDHIQSRTATHDPGCLQGLLAEAIGSHEKAVAILREAMAGQPVEVRMLPQPTTRLSDLLATDSVEVSPKA